MSVSEVDWTLVTAVVDGLVPADGFPSAGQVGLVGRLATDAAELHHRLWSTLLAPGLLALGEEVRARGLEPFGELGAPSWQMVGYDPALKRPSRSDGTWRPAPTRRLRDAAPGYDVVGVGDGAGGGVAASVLAGAGLRVLAVDRGRYLGYEDVGQDHLRNFRLSRYGLNAPPGPDAGARVVVDADGAERAVAPWEAGWSAPPQTIGGGTRLHQGMAWRLMPEDFSLASAHGVPGGSSLADWPITYDDLEPYCTEAEQRIGVSGDGTAHQAQGFRSAECPMPPLPMDSEASVLQRGVDALGLSTGPVPMLINSEPRDGRGRCGQCGECVGSACPTGAKNGPYNALLPAAVATGRCDVVALARAVRITTDARGEVTGVQLVDERTGERALVSAGHVVVAAAAIETARLLLHSRSDAHPHGLGNRTDQVGRHLQGHLYVGGFGLFDEPVIDGAGPNVRIATCDHVHGMPGVLGGGVLANEVLELPVLHWSWALPPEAPRWGLAGKHAVRDLHRRTSHVFGPIQEVPTADVRVTLDPARTDRHGVPVTRSSGSLHPEDARTAEALQARAVEWLEASGATRTWSTPISMGLTAGQHQAGTARMGTDPATSVTDPTGRVHGHDDLWVMDGSVRVVNRGFNPVLTILALAFWAAHALGRA